MTCETAGPARDINEEMRSIAQVIIGRCYMLEVKLNARNHPDIEIIKEQALALDKCLCRPPAGGSK